MTAKNREKIQPLGHFFGLELEKNCDFARFGRKIKINRDLVEMLQNFRDTSIKIHIGFAKFRSIPNKSPFFLFLLPKHAKSQLMLCQEPNLSADEPTIVKCSWELASGN